MNNYSKQELVAIATSIQTIYKGNLAGSYNRAFRDIIYNNEITGSDKSKLLEVIGNYNEPNDHPICKSDVDIGDILRKIGLAYGEYLSIEYLSRFRLPSVNNIIDELIGLSNEFGGFHFSKNRFITIEAGPFTIKNIEFGKFQIKLDTMGLASYNDSAIMKVETDTPNYADGDEYDQHIHPHIRDGVICFGNGLQAHRNASKECRILDIYCIISSILNTYNKDDPYQRIEVWSNNNCKDCGDYYGNQDIATCNECGEIYCSDCITSCCRYKKPVCGNCAVRNNNFSCKECGSSLCENCIEVCNKCNFKYCNDHENDHYCSCLE